MDIDKSLKIKCFKYIIDKNIMIKGLKKNKNLK